MKHCNATPATVLIEKETTKSNHVCGRTHIEEIEQLRKNEGVLCGHGCCIELLGCTFINVNGFLVFACL